MSGRALRPVQSRDTAPTAYEHTLAGAIEQVFSAGTHDLPGLVAGLNELEIAPPTGGSWTEASLRTELKRLGA